MLAFIVGGAAAQRSLETLPPAWLERAQASCPGPLHPTLLTRSPSRADRGEQVEVELPDGVAMGEIYLLDPYTPFELKQNDLERSGVEFQVPYDAAGGVHLVCVETDLGTTFVGVLEVFGEDVVRDESGRTQAVIVVEADDQRRRALLESLLADLERSFDASFEIVREKPLDGEGPVCSGDLFVVDVGGIPLGKLIEALKASNGALWIDPQNHYGGGAGHYLEAIGAHHHDRSAWGDGVRIVVLDSGFTGAGAGSSVDVLHVDTFTNGDDDFVHPSIQAGDNLRYHGTAVVRAAQEVAPGAELLSIKTCDEHGRCLLSDVIEGMCLALHHEPSLPTALNLSMSSDTRAEALEALLRYATQERGVLVAAAAGNVCGLTHSEDECNERLEGESLYHYRPRYPAGHRMSGLLAVGALDIEANVPAPWSVRGDFVDVWAPGEGFSFTMPNGQTYTYSGTSFATPLVAGVLAAVRATGYRAGDPGAVATCMRNSPQVLQYTPHTYQIEYRPLDIGAALANCPN
jgi:subtilisin